MYLLLQYNRPTKATHNDEPRQEDIKRRKRFIFQSRSEKEIRGSHSCNEQNRTESVPERILRHFIFFVAAHGLTRVGVMSRFFRCFFSFFLSFSKLCSRFEIFRHWMSEEKHQIEPNRSKYAPPTPLNHSIDFKSDENSLKDSRRVHHELDHHRGDKCHLGLLNVFSLRDTSTLSGVRRLPVLR